MKTACIYHSECIDGTSAAAVVRYQFPDAVLLPFRHGDIPRMEELRDAQVFIVDFSFPAEVMKQIKSEAATLSWYDHHKTALPIREALGFGDIDLDESGATLTWKKLFPDKSLPRILEYVRDKDLWLWKLPDSREISADLREMEGALDPHSPSWKKLLDGVTPDAWQGMIARGHRSRRLLRERIERGVKKGFPVEMDGFQAFAVNWSEDSSDLGEHIYKELGHPVALMFSYNGKEWIFSLRSNTVDVSTLAVKRGGGGHPGAAGFRTPGIQWLFDKRV